jgi:hypothetical protein
MPLTFDGSGTVAGLVPGGLPDGVITNPDLAANAVSRTKLDADTSTGVCKAWVNFNGTGTVAIRASYNVSSITDNGTGAYTVNFATALVDANYSVVYGAAHDGFTDGVVWSGFATYATSGIGISTGSSSTGSFADLKVVSVAIFR